MRFVVNLLALYSLSLLGPALFTADQVWGHDDANAHEHHHDHDHQSNSAASFMTTRDSPVVLPPPAEGDDVFHFVVYGDRTGGVPAGLKVLRQAVKDTNLLDPDLVMTVGDLIQGYNEAPEWMEQMTEYKEIMEDLKMKWYPVAGNHDVYWRGKGRAPAGHHEANYEKHFGPLWYSFQHKNAGFVVLYSDEGDPATNLKAFNVGALQNMSDQQLAFLEKALSGLKDADHVFVFLHHPRWIGGGYTGSNWPAVEQKLVAAGNVSAVFAGHVHHMRYDHPENGIAYYTLATTGGHLSGDIPDAGYLHHLNMVTVRKERISVSALPIGAVIDPKQFTPEFLAEVDDARKIRPKHTSPPPIIEADGSCQAEIAMSIANPTPFPVAVTLMDDAAMSKGKWVTTLDHQHIEIAPNETKEINFEIRRDVSGGFMEVIPAVRMEIEALTSTARVRLPEVITPLDVRPGQVPADYFTAQANQCLVVDRETSAIRVDAGDIQLPNGPMTLEAWVSMNKLAGYTGIIAKTESSDFALFNDEGTPDFSIYLDGRYVHATAKEPLTVNQWTHVAGVYDGQSVSLFVDGKQVDTTQIRRKRDGDQTLPVIQKRNKQPLFLGADPDTRGNPSRPFSGKIDEVRLSKTARYSRDFVAAKRFAPDDDTVFLFHLDRAIGPFVLDHSDNAAMGVFGKTSRLAPVAP